MESSIKRAELTRQADLIDVDAITNLRVLVVGAGAIGSFATLALAKMGCTNITVNDHDEVDIVNMNAQFYPRTSIGQRKVTALQSMVHTFTGVTISALPCKYKAKSDIYDVVLVAVDSMAARKEIFETVTAKYLIDTRMSAEKYSQYVVDMRSGSSKAKYEKTLHSDEAAVQERCTAKSTIYTALTAASMVCKAVKNIIAKEPYPRTILMDLKQSENNVMMYT